MNVFAVAAAMMFLNIVYSLRRDMATRDFLYTKPLSQMPENANSLAQELFKEATKDEKLNSEQVLKIQNDIYEMLAKGAVAQRNWEMQKTREQISFVGQFLSWFMKQKGLSFEQIQAKYEKEFSESERLGYQKIIESASRSNAGLVTKLYMTLIAKFRGQPTKTVVKANL